MYDDFCEQAMLSELDKQILELRIKEYSLTQISMELGYCKTTISNRIKRLLEKYDEVQRIPGSGLPARYLSDTEEWMNTH